MKSIKTTSQVFAGLALLYTLYDLTYHGVAKASIKVRTLAELWQDTAGAEGFSAGKSALRSMTNTHFANTVCEQYVPVLLLAVAGVVYAVFHVVCVIKGKDKSSRI